MATSTIQKKGGTPEYTTVTYNPLHNLHASPIGGGSWHVYSYGAYASAAFDGNKTVTLGITQSGYTPVGIDTIYCETNSLGSNSWDNFKVSGNTLVATLENSAEQEYGSVNFPTVYAIKIKYIKD